MSTSVRANSLPGVGGPVPAERGGVAGERHFSAQRASLVAGGGFALLASGVAALLAPVAAVDPFRVLTMEGAFSVFLVGSLAAVGARMLPTLLHQHAEEQRMAVEDAELERVVALGMGPLDSGREDQEVSLWASQESSLRVHASTYLGETMACS